jgi:hypothetical protein
LGREKLERMNVGTVARKATKATIALPKRKVVTDPKAVAARKVVTVERNTVTTVTATAMWKPLFQKAN